MYGTECDDLATDSNCTQFCAAGYDDNNNNNGQAYICPAGVFSGTHIECSASLCPEETVSNSTAHLNSFEVVNSTGSTLVLGGVAVGYTLGTATISCVNGFFSASGLSFTMSCSAVAPGVSEWANSLTCGYATVVDLHWPAGISHDDVASFEVAMGTVLMGFSSDSEFSIIVDLSLDMIYDVAITVVFTTQSDRDTAAASLEDYDFSALGLTDGPEVYVYDPNPEVIAAAASITSVLPVLMSMYVALVSTK